MKTMILTLPLLWLTFGCQAHTTTTVQIPQIQHEDIDITKPSEKSCGADELKYLIGKPRSVLHTMKFGEDVRIIEADSSVTMDYSPTRLNINIDKKGLISGVNCG